MKLAPTSVIGALTSVVRALTSVVCALTLAVHACLHLQTWNSLDTNCIRPRHVRYAHAHATETALILHCSVCGKNYKDDGFTRSNLNVWGLVGLIIFYVVILSMGIVISWYKRSVGERDSDRAIVAGREIGLGVGIITLTGN